MSIYIGDKEIKDLKIGTTTPSAVYLGENKVRPSATPITTAGIYRNETDGLISLSSDGSTRYTIADKNLGATTVYNDGDTFSEDNCGGYFQRGNNYMFPYTGTITTSATRVNAGTYGPGNYYNSSTFIYRSSSPYSWDTSANANLRGDTTNTNVARRGPCPEGYHVMSYNERQAFNTAYKAIVGSWNTANAMKHFLMPISSSAKWRNRTNGNPVKGFGYWLSTQNANTNYYAHTFVLYNSGSTTGVDRGVATYKTYGFFIRPMKNEAVQPDTSRTKLN